MVSMKSKSSPIRRIYFALAFMMYFSVFIFNCQHARIRMEPELPQECKPWVEKKSEASCMEAWSKLKERRDSIPTVEKEYEQIYYYWGFSPDDISLRLDEECPKGVVEIYQYSTFKNALYEQLTIGFYSPRTLRLTCLTEELKPEIKPTGGRRR
jgi:hypothetical protein